MVQAGPMTRHAEDLKPLLKILVGDKIHLLKLDVPVTMQNVKVYYIEENRDIKCSSVCQPLREALKKYVSYSAKLK